MVLPVLREAARGHGQKCRGEVAGGDPRENEETRIVDDKVEMALTLGGSPADEEVARGGLPSRRAESQESDNFPLGLSEVAELRARQRAVSEIVVALDVLVPEQGLCPRGDKFQLQIVKLAGRFVKWRLGLSGWSPPQKLAAVGGSVAWGRAAQQTARPHPGAGKPA